MDTLDFQSDGESEHDKPTFTLNSTYISDWWVTSSDIQFEPCLSERINHLVASGSTWFLAIEILLIIPEQRSETRQHVSHSIIPMETNGTKADNSILSFRVFIALVNFATDYRCVIHSGWWGVGKDRGKNPFSIKHFIQFRRRFFIVSMMNAIWGREFSIIFSFFSMPLRRTSRKGWKRRRKQTDLVSIL